MNFADAWQVVGIVLTTLVASALTPLITEYVRDHIVGRRRRKDRKDDLRVAMAIDLQDRMHEIVLLAVPVHESIFYDGSTRKTLEPKYREKTLDLAKLVARLSDESLRIKIFDLLNALRGILLMENPPTEEEFKEQSHELMKKFIDISDELGRIIRED